VLVDHHPFTLQAKP
jgi:hypothetical protein